jgi:hypothetical protein
VILDYRHFGHWPGERITDMAKIAMSVEVEQEVFDELNRREKPSALIAEGIRLALALVDAPEEMWKPKEGEDASQHPQAIAEASRSLFREVA